jgi:hypothetical protein
MWLLISGIPRLPYGRARANSMKNEQLSGTFGEPSSRLAFTSRPALLAGRLPAELAYPLGVLDGNLLFDPFG